MVREILTAFNNSASVVTTLEVHAAPYSYCPLSEQKKIQIWISLYDITYRSHFIKISSSVVETLTMDRRR
jgi:hypothetical protein